MGPSMACIPRCASQLRAASNSWLAAAWSSTHSKKPTPPVGCANVCAVRPLMKAATRPRVWPRASVSSQRMRSPDSKTYFSAGRIRRSGPGRGAARSWGRGVEAHRNRKNSRAWAGVTTSISCIALSIFYQDLRKQISRSVKGCPRRVSQCCSASKHCEHGVLHRETLREIQFA